MIAGRRALVFLTSLTLACTVTHAGLRARQGRGAGDGVYAAAQAQRGEALFKERCASCHGATLGGNIGPPLAGDAFLGVWAGRTLADVFDKILDTMPPEAAGTLTRPQVADLVAHILQANRFPAGRADLDAGEASLRQISLAAPPRAAGAGSIAFPAVGNMNQVMRGILFPASNALFDVQLEDPGAPPKPRANADATTTTARYSNVYGGWVGVDAAAIALAESAPLLMTPGRRCENGKPVPVDRADWQKYVQGLVEAGRAAYRASQRRNQEAVAEATNQISDACANCHRVYRDTPTAAQRCG